MTEHAKPVFEDPAASAELREFVAFAREDGPSAADLQRLATRVAPALGVAVVSAAKPDVFGSAPTGIGASELGAGQAGLFGKLWAASSTKLLAAIGLGVGLGIGLGFGHFAPAPVHEPTVVVPMRRSSDAQPRSAQETNAPTTSAATTEREGVPAFGPTTSALEPATPAPTLKRARSKPRAALAPTEPVAVDEFPSELALITEAEGQRTNPARALAVLARHARLYPRGALAQEREVLAIELLLQSGELAEAQRRAHEFELRYQDSAHLPRVRALVVRTARAAE